MKVDEIQKICVVGAGQMGRQIALQAALSGYTVCLTDNFPEAVKKAEDWAGTYLKERVKKGKLTKDQAEAVQTRFTTVGSLTDAAASAQLVIEAIVERVDVKRALFQKLADIVSEETLLTTNSSFLVSSLFQDCVKNPARLANLHYFNPALVMKLVEVVRGPHTSDETVETLVDFVRTIGKVPVTIQKEVDGFIVNHISSELTCAAIKLVAQGIATPEDIDLALENGLNHPLGPFRMMDLTGIDLAYDVLLEKEKKGEYHEGIELIRDKVAAGELGRKTGCGWYDYSEK